MFTPDLLMYTHHTCTRGSGAEEGGRMREAGREKQEGRREWGKEEGEKMEDGVEKEKAGKEIIQGMHSR